MRLNLSIDPYVVTQFFCQDLHGWFKHEANPIHALILIQGKFQHLTLTRNHITVTADNG